jgi:hypothetical protein
MRRIAVDIGEVPAHRATHDLLRSALPFRTFRWYYGQRHYSGSYWSATMSTHVIYESRLELSRLLMADFDQSVKFTVAQPFLIRSRVQGVVRHHIPDYLLLTDANPVLVDVKPREHANDTKVAETFAWVQNVIESLGWRFEIASEQPPVLLDNVRFLAGYRRPQSINEPALRALQATLFDNVTFGDAVRSVTGAEPLVRAARNRRHNLGVGHDPRLCNRGDDRHGGLPTACHHVQVWGVEVFVEVDHRDAEWPDRRGSEVEHPHTRIAQLGPIGMVCSG